MINLHGKIFIKFCIFFVSCPSFFWSTFVFIYSLKKKQFMVICQTTTKTISLPIINHLPIFECYKVWWRFYNISIIIYSRYSIIIDPSLLFVWYSFIIDKMFMNTQRKLIISVCICVYWTHIIWKLYDMSPYTVLDSFLKQF